MVSLSTMDPQDISRYRSWLLANPSAFVEGVRGFCKQAAAVRLSQKELSDYARTAGYGDGQTANIPHSELVRLAKEKAKSEVGKKVNDINNDGKSLWEKVKPWILGLAGGYLALSAGDKWGRFAQKHNYSYGPVTGPFRAALGAFLPDSMKIRNTLTQQEAAHA